MYDLFFLRNIEDYKRDHDGVDGNWFPNDPGLELCMELVVEFVDPDEGSGGASYVGTYYVCMQRPRECVFK